MRQKIRVVDAYELSRVLALVEALSRDFATQLHTVLGSTPLLHLSYEEFQREMTHVPSCFQQWEAQFQTLYELIREVGKKRGVEVLTLSQLTFEHQVVERRVSQVRVFRQHHARLCDVLSRTLGHSNDELQRAYDVFRSTNQDVLSSNAVNNSWNSSMRTYDACVDKLEAAIIGDLTERLASTTTALEMFRVFSKFNPLFFRPNVLRAVQRFQMHLIEKVRTDVQKLAQKFKRGYDQSDAAVISTLRDIPAFAGAMQWAKQIERQLNMYMKRVQDVLGSSWEQHVQGKALKNIAEAFRAKLDTQPKFDAWVVAFSHSSASAQVSGPIFSIESSSSVTKKISSSAKKRRCLVVHFDPEIITLFKEVRHLDGMGFRVPYTIKAIAAEAKEKYPFAMRLEATLKAWTSLSSTFKGHPTTDDESHFETQSSNLLLASSRRSVRQLLVEAVVPATSAHHRRHQLSWDSGSELEAYVNRFTRAVEDVQNQAQDVSEKCHVLARHFAALENCPYDVESFTTILRQIQVIADDCNLSNYSNCEQWVTHLNVRVDDICARRLDSALASWIRAFEEEDDTTSKDDKPTHITKHQVVLQHHVLHLEPSVESARAYWLGEITTLAKVIGQLPTLSHSAFDRAMMISNHSSTQSIQNTDRTHLVTTTCRVSFHKAVQVIEHMLAHVSNYTASWLQYQALWDMDMKQIKAACQDNLHQWLDLVTDIQLERSDNNIDCNTGARYFGSRIVVSYLQVQNQVNLKYDVWQRECVEIFGQLLFDESSELWTELAQRRVALEEVSSGSSDIVEHVTLIHDSLRHKQPQWKIRIDLLEVSIRCLKKQRYHFPTDFPSLVQIQGEWDALNQILERKARLMALQLPQLQTKIRSQERELHDETQTLVSDWGTEKPVHSTITPVVALDRMARFRSQFERRDAALGRLERAKIALSMTSEKTQGPAESLADMRQVLASSLKELTGLEEVWTWLSDFWTRMEALQETLWTAVQPRKIRKILDQELSALQQAPARLRQYPAFEQMQHRLAEWKGLNKFLVELKGDCIKDRHWKLIFKQLGFRNHKFHELTLGHLYRAQMKSHELALESIFQQAQGEMALDEFLNREVRNYWNEQCFQLVPYQQRCQLIRGWEELFQKLDEHQTSLTSMQHSPYYSIFAEEGGLWEEKLNKIQQILNSWIDVQRKWIYLEGLSYYVNIRI